jgi:uncharacterized membrane protein
MVDLIVITFDEENDAAEALRSMRDLERQGALSLTDTAVIAKDPDGKVHVKNEWSSGAETGAVVGGALGLLTTFFFPVVGTAIGAAAGAWIGGMFESGVDPKFVKDVSESLQPGKSALFLMLRGSEHAALRAALEPYRGQVYQTTLPDDFRESLQQALNRPAPAADRTG